MLAVFLVDLEITMKNKPIQQPLVFFLSLFTIASLLSSQLTAPAQAAGLLTLADFEGGAPPGWFVFNGASTVTTSTQVVAESDPLALPGQIGSNEILAAVFNISDFGGFGQDLAAAGGPQDWSGASSFSFWFHGSGSGLSYQAEISDNRSDPNSDTSERFDYTFVDSAPGWQFFDIPFTDFTRATDFQPGGAPNDGFTLTEIYAWAIVLPQGAGTVYFDDFALSLPGVTFVDDFESGLPAGTDGSGNPIGFFTFTGSGATVAISATAAPPAPVPGSSPTNHVLQIDTSVPANSWAGFVHAFENDSLDTWLTQDWSSFVGLRLWLYGTNTGSTLFFDVLDNRSPGTTGDSAERYTVDVVDNFSGWQLVELPFASFHRKDIGNGAPNDGFTLTQVHGWAFGVYSSEQALTHYLDDASLYGTAEIPDLTVGFAANNHNVTEGSSGEIAVRLNRALNDTDPDQVTVDYAVEPGAPIPGREYTPVSGTLTFTRGGPSQQSFALQTFDDSKYEGDERVILRLSNPVGAAPGFIMQASGTIVDDDPYDPSLLDDFETFPYLWQSSENVILDSMETTAGDPLALPGQGAYEGILSAVVPLRVDVNIQGRICNGGGVIPVVLPTTPAFDATTVDHTTIRLGNAAETHVDRRTGQAQRHAEDADGDGDLDLVFHFRFRETGLACDPAAVSFNGWTFDGRPITAGGADASFTRPFALGQDWSASDGLSFWYYGQNTGDSITALLLDNRVPDPGPGAWDLVWTDEFDGPAGAPPDPANWTHEIGDGTLNGIPGWGNQELQYYTAGSQNAAADGDGSLVITVREADGSLQCYYGPCEYTSARLLTSRKAEFAYGRIEARIQVPSGGPGLWPAYWSLGTDIGQVGWPQTGEIDMMEYVSRLPEEIFGTIHGPGYSGGQSFGGTYTFDQPVSGAYHTFAIQWQPDRIEWTVDGILYHTAEPADVAPNQWVFNDPIFLIFNMAVGGNFGGPVSPDTTFPQEMRIDYVRVYQGPDTAERFEAAFVDDFSGWQLVSLPFSSFTRSLEQPADAPDDGLGLTEVWGYGFRLPDGGTQTGQLWLDQVRLAQPTELVVTNTNDSGPGSLRDAIGRVAGGGLVTFDPGLAGGTVALTSGPLVIAGKEVTVDGSAAPGLAISGGGTDRVLIVDPGGAAAFKHLTLRDGYGWDLAGGILNNGTLILDHAWVTANTMATAAGDFWKGGGGIYNGGGATLTLVDTSVTGNTSGHDGGGVFVFLGSAATIERSTISGNTAANVGGGLRTLTNVGISNTTISGNTANAWHGGALFVTDGVVTLTNVTAAGNHSPAGTADLFVGTFTDASATLILKNSLVDSAQANCFLAPFGSGAVALTADAYNVFTDASCFAGATDQVVGDAGIGPLANNGGPNWTHALLPGSPAVDAVPMAACTLTVDQRGVARPQGVQCDAGAFELEQ
jgi:beta-glucanase (GH16 family)